MKLSVKFIIVLFLSVLAAGVQAQTQSDDVYKVISSHKELSKFTDLIDSGDLKDFLKSKDDVMTVFAPTNDAIEKLPSAVWKRAKSDKAKLQSLIKYHVISGSEVFSGNIHGRRASPSASNGESLSFNGTGKTTKINEAELVNADIHASNGVIHIIDAVLVPPSLQDEPVANDSPSLLDRLKGTNAPDVATKAALVAKPVVAEPKTSNDIAISATPALAATATPAKSAVPTAATLKNTATANLLTHTGTTANSMQQTATPVAVVPAPVAAPVEAPAEPARKWKIFGW